ncbi:hypothetical protein GCM10009801_08290 [Streptomyces albiaxialis]|uniref:Methylamine utilisation protein MauE domain-containing protein n=1 Tax=Streptomyces albiaxialis TaxID=329523 RepID=A0ABP5H5T8_9ACTN
MDYALLTCRLLLGGIFVVSAASKLRGRVAFREFESAARGMGAPARFLRPVAVAVVAVECLIPPLLLVPPGGLPGLLLSGALLLVLTAALAGALRRGTRTSCACFGSSTAPVGRRHVARNAALLAVVAAGVPMSLSGAPELPAHPGGIATAAFAALVGGLLVVSLDALTALLTDAPATPRET